jgi:hypothetical protein
VTDANGKALASPRKKVVRRSIIKTASTLKEDLQREAAAAQMQAMQAVSAKNTGSLQPSSTSSQLLTTSLTQAISQQNVNQITRTEALSRWHGGVEAYNTGDFQQAISNFMV